MSINFISNPVYVINEINTLNYIYSNTLKYRYKNFQDKKIYLKLKYNDKGKVIKNITI
tara:strand:+ start:479 stop:652 length:174 start_codon:yes stop_codon:yes gene_type:complete